MSKIASYTILAMILMGLLYSCGGQDSPKKAWVVSNFAGSGTAGFANGDGDAAQFKEPYGVAVDTLGNIYVADTKNNRIRKITPEGEVSTLAGDGTTTQFNSPFGVAVDTSGNIYVADTGNSRIRKITPERVVSTFAGSGTDGFADGTGTDAQFHHPNGVAVDTLTLGNIYVADTGNSQIRKITSERAVSNFAGSSSYGFADGTGTAAKFFSPAGVAVDSLGNIYVADEDNHRIRKITPGGEVSTIAGSTRGFKNGFGTAAQFYAPQGVAVDSSGNIYVADTSNHRIRKITPKRVVSTIAGSARGSENGVGTAAQFNIPRGVAVDTLGNIYVADTGNHQIRKIEYKVP